MPRRTTVTVRSATSTKLPMYRSIAEIGWPSRTNSTCGARAPGSPFDSRIDVRLAVVDEVGIRHHRRRPVAIELDVHVGDRRLHSSVPRSGSLRDVAVVGLLDRLMTAGMALGVVRLQQRRTGDAAQHQCQLPGGLCESWMPVLPPKPPVGGIVGGVAGEEYGPPGRRGVQADAIHLSTASMWASSSTPDRRPHELERAFVGDAVGDEAGASALMSPTVNTQRKPPRPVRSNRKNPRQVGLLT